MTSVVHREWPGHELVKQLRMLASVRKAWVDGVNLCKTDQPELFGRISDLRVTCRDDEPLPP